MGLEEPGGRMIPRAEGEERAMVVDQLVSEAAYVRLVVSDPDDVWELHDGQLVEKPGMSWEHGRAVALLGSALVVQVDWAEFEVRVNEGRVRHPAGSYFVPDIVVVPASLAQRYANQSGTPPVFDEPLPLVVEAWSPSTGAYDVVAKLPAYQERGDFEIWFLHPYERTLTAWVRRADGSYGEVVYRDGVVRTAFLPGVAIRLEDVFRR